jgi:hypothetical protein
MARLLGDGGSSRNTENPRERGWRPIIGDPKPAVNGGPITLREKPRERGCKETVRRFRRRLRKMQQDYAAGRVSSADIFPCLISWIGHARQADTYRLRGRLFDTIRFQRATTE